MTKTYVYLVRLRNGYEQVLKGVKYVDLKESTYCFYNADDVLTDSVPVYLIHSVQLSEEGSE